MNFRIALMLGTLAVSSPAQQEMVKTEIVTLAIDEPVTNLYFKNEQETSSFQANLTGLSEPLAYKGPQRLILRASEAEFAAEPPLPPPAAAVDLPLKSDKVLLVCVKSKDKPLQLIPYDIASGKGAAGDYRFFNFSHSTLSLIFGSKKFVIKPGSNLLVTDSSWKSEVMEMDVEMAIIKDGKPKRVYSSAWGHRPGRRNYVFMFDGPQTYKPIKICRFFDVPSIVKPPAS